MKNKPYANSMSIGAREEASKTSWKKKRGTMAVVDQHRFGSTTMGNGAETHDTTNGGGRTLEVSNSFKNRNLSVNQSTL